MRERSALKHRVHAQLLAFGHRCPVSDLFGRRGRELLARLEFPEPWRSGVLAAVAMIDDLDREIAAIDRELIERCRARLPLLMSGRGLAWVLGTRIASAGHPAPHREAVRLHRAVPRASRAIRARRTRGRRAERDASLGPGGSGRNPRSRRVAVGAVVPARAPRAGPGGRSPRDAPRAGSRLAAGPARAPAGRARGRDPAGAPRPPAGLAPR